jgi:hypothetical protein
MKISVLPTTAIAFTVLAILAVVFNRMGLTHLETVWPALLGYSAVIAAAAWQDRRWSLTNYNAVIAATTWLNRRSSPRIETPVPSGNGGLGAE